MKALAIGRIGVLQPLLGTRFPFPEVRRLIPRILGTVFTVLEALLIYAWLAQRVPAGYLIAAHFAIVLGYLFASKSLSGSLSGAIAVRSAMLLLIGPLASVSLIASLLEDGSREKAKSHRTPAGVVEAAAPAATEELQRSHSDLVYEQIVAGRRSRREPANRESLRQIIEIGDLDAQQFVIAMISQRYEPVMFPALESALQSSTPAVRVQAAAVFAKLRERMSREAKEILGKQDDLHPGAPLGVEAYDQELAVRCRRLADSGFVDAETGVKLKRLAETLMVGDTPKSDSAPTGPFAGHVHGTSI